MNNLFFSIKLTNFAAVKPTYNIAIWRQLIYQQIRSPQKESARHGRLHKGSRAVLWFTTRAFLTKES